MTLSENQQEFALDIAYLVMHINAAGYACTYGDAYRSPRAFGGMGEKGPYGRNKSAHKQRLAVDLNLFKDGVYLEDTADHRPFGEYWKALRPINRWGGDFLDSRGRPTKDGNHYSRLNGGIA